MIVTLNDLPAEFHPWRPDCGRVFSTAFSFDTETTLIDEEQPWITPAYVLGAAFDGGRGYLIRREHAAAFFAEHSGVPVVMHHAPFDLAVVQLVAPQMDVYGLLDRNLIWDTQLLHRLLALAREGHTACGKGQSTLEHCAQQHVGLHLPKDVKDSQGNPVRLSYGQWLNRPPQQIEPVYLEYLARDAMVTYLLFQRLQDLLEEVLPSSSDAFGYVSDQWLAEQIGLWGWQTHHIQLKAAVVLQAISANGLHVDLRRRNELLVHLDEVAQENREVLRRYGYLPGEEGSGKALQEILRRLEVHHPELRFLRTPTGAYATSQEALEPLAGGEPFVDALLAFKAVEKLRSAFLEKMGRRVLHPSFDVLKNTGRTSSFGDLNAQNLPRDDRIRSCFVPSDGHVFIDADYSTLELATLAQAVQSQFNIRAAMAEAINRGIDLHRLVAARVANKQEHQVTAEERQRAKAINFGKPGGMGDARLKTYALASYHIELSDEEVRGLTESWFLLFPEMQQFLDHGERDIGEDVSRFFDLTPRTYFEHTGIASFLQHPDNQGRENLPHSILGWMCLKVVRDEHPQTQEGRPYCPEETDFFWTQVSAQIDAIPPEFHAAINSRTPSERLRAAVIRAVDRRGVYTLTGRLRARASYCARHNTVFQGLAADGAKLALWKLWRAGYRIVNFIHDEVLIEIPQASDLRHHANAIRSLMIAGMREVVPDVQIDVQYAATTRWCKSARTIHDEEGNLLAWTPERAGQTAGASP